jgi:hypothetical protein
MVGVSVCSYCGFIHEGVYCREFCESIADFLEVTDGNQVVRWVYNARADLGPKLRRMAQFGIDGESDRALVATVHWGCHGLRLAVR